MFSSIIDNYSKKHMEWEFLNEFRVSVEKAIRILSIKNNVVLLTKELKTRHEFTLEPSIILKEGRAQLFIKGVMPIVIYESGVDIPSAINEAIYLSNKVKLAVQDDKNKYHIDLHEELIANVNALISHFNAPLNLKIGDTPIAVAIDSENKTTCVIYARTFSHFEPNIPASIKKEVVVQHFSKQGPLDAALIKTLGIENDIKSIQAVLSGVK